MGHDSDKAKLKKENAEQLFIRYKELMFKVAYSILHNEADAEDAVSESFRVMWEKDRLPQADSKTAKAFLVIAVKNTALNLLKKDRHLMESDFDEFIKSIPDKQDPDSALVSAIGELPGDYREIIILRYYIGYSAKEIADIKGLKANTVFIKLAKARKLLEEKLEEEK